MEEELQNERQKRADLEGLRAAHEELIRDKQTQLDAIEESRHTVDQQLQVGGWHQVSSCHNLIQWSLGHLNKILK